MPGKKNPKSSSSEQKSALLRSYEEVAAELRQTNIENPLQEFITRFNNSVQSVNDCNNIDNKNTTAEIAKRIKLLSQTWDLVLYVNFFNQPEQPDTKLAKQLLILAPQAYSLYQNTAVIFGHQIATEALKEFDQYLNGSAATFEEIKTLSKAATVFYQKALQIDAMDLCKLEDSSKLEIIDKILIHFSIFEPNSETLKYYNLAYDAIKNKHTNTNLVPQTETATAHRQSLSEKLQAKAMAELFAEEKNTSTKKQKKRANRSSKPAQEQANSKTIPETKETPQNQFSAPCLQLTNLLLTTENSDKKPEEIVTDTPCELSSESSESKAANLVNNLEKPEAQKTKPSGIEIIKLAREAAEKRQREGRGSTAVNKFLENDPSSANLKDLRKSFLEKILSEDKTLGR